MLPAMGSSPSNVQGDADWTVGAAKWCAVGVLGALCAWGMVWATWLSPARVPISRGEPTAVVSESDVGVAGVPSRAGGGLQPSVGSTLDNPAPEGRPVRTTVRLNLNTATRLELEALPGIGPTLAERILEVRGRLGRFSSVEQLELVPGIGPRRMEQIRPMVRVE
jgi:competence protein ComEA